MLLRLAYLAVTNTFSFIRLLPMRDREKEIEILVLRHQLTILQRQSELAGLLHRLPMDKLRQLQLLVRPDTIPRWHRNFPSAASSAPSPKYDPALSLIPSLGEGGGAGRARDMEPEPELTDLSRGYLTEKGVPQRRADRLRQALDELLAGTGRERIRPSASSLATRCRSITRVERHLREPVRGLVSFRRGRV